MLYGIGEQKDQTDFAALAYKTLLETEIKVEHFFQAQFFCLESNTSHVCYLLNEKKKNKKFQF